MGRVAFRDGKGIVVEGKRIVEGMHVRLVYRVIGRELGLRSRPRLDRTIRLGELKVEMQVRGNASIQLSLERLVAVFKQNLARS